MPFDLVASDSKGGAGGTCVLRGCVPKKLMVYGGEFAQAFKDSKGFGSVAHPLHPSCRLSCDCQEVIARKKTLATLGLIESDKAWRCRFQANCTAFAELQHQSVTCLHQAVTWLHDARQRTAAATDPFVKQAVCDAGGMSQSPA